jgi:hypothetical protein
MIFDPGWELMMDWPVWAQAITGIGMGAFIGLAFIGGKE